MGDDERRAEVEAVALLEEIVANYPPTTTDWTLEAWFEDVNSLLDRLRDARGDDEGLTDDEHGYFAAGGTDTCPACDADALDYLERRKAEAARSPQGEDHETARGVCASCGGDWIHCDCPAAGESNEGGNQ